ncbi:hepatitis A virus cellular receptor 1 homolog isoform X5 [Notolabrus celidotus]|uniref:hepatitis A virus cellular receptor 1 homolog isoform X5 n=1 Tax=Notolabrus celidotus TaxID=1203425 RepID=UPI00148F60AB|nr:hepatitis A virus cellular receptor 1 homolog isoform X5 [Notolabrus celidotus]
MSVVGRVGQNITLPCSYNTKRNVVRRVCWGRGDIPNSGCSKELISTDGLKEFTERRYQLRGWLDEGDVSLTILNLTESDAGRYGCRVHIPGLFNDEKHHVDLTIEEATQTATKTSGYRETTTEPTQTYTAGQLTSTEMAFTSSSRSMRAEPQQESSSLTMVLVLVLLGLLAFTAGGVLLITRRWRRLKVPQQQVSSSARFSLTPSTLQLHRRESVVENIYQIDGGEYEYCP